MQEEVPVNEVILSDEEYVIYRTKSSQKTNRDHAKAWMILAKTLFPRNFDVQFEAYAAHKSSNNPKDAARYFSSLFYDFPHEPGLWKEVHEITEGLQSTVNSKTSQFYCDLFSNMLFEVQHEILTSMAERTDNVINYCRVLLVLFSKFPQSLAVHGRKLMERLIAAEKSAAPGTPVNSYRKALIVDLLPVFIASKMADLTPVEQQQLLILSIEYYSGIALNETKDVDGSNVTANQTWSSLFSIVQSISQTLGWRLFASFTSDANREQLCQSVLAFAESVTSSNEDSPDFLQLLYSAMVLLLESLSVYKNSIYIQSSKHGANQDKALLISVCPISENAEVASSNDFSRHSSAKFVRSFHIALKCWELVHKTEKLSKSSKKLLAVLRSDQWQWLPIFVVDSLIYHKRYSEAYSKLSAVVNETPKCPALLLKLAGILFSLHDHPNSVDHAIRSVEMLVEAKETSEIKSISPGKILPEIDFISYSFTDLLSYSVKILIGCLRMCVQRSDLALGHLLVLLQYEWPANYTVFEELIDKIRRQGRLSYPLFEIYVIHAAILEEFALMASEQPGGVSLDIFPSSVSAYSTTHRMTTRRGDQGAKEDFRGAIKRQIGRNSMQSLQDLVVNFICKERASIAMACSIKS